MVNAKALWESLERKYKTEDAGSKKFVVGKFLDFKMMDSKTVISQVQEFQLILHDIHAEGMVLGESFQVAALIEKLPPTWKDFKNYLKHKRKEMKLEDLIVRLRIEEDNRQSEKKAGNYHQEAKANVVEQDLGQAVVPLRSGPAGIARIPELLVHRTCLEERSPHVFDLVEQFWRHVVVGHVERAPLPAGRADFGAEENGVAHGAAQVDWRDRVVVGGAGCRVIGPAHIGLRDECDRQSMYDHGKHRQR
ncbi:hypothetical protein RJ639_045776 [Escallonia herrerae]|uniref:Zinc finger, CCHC-type n=1 Tax=Escallonia herrerae TaxID=1293975 RepID=A0AA88WHQ4_9ASTE|nr:hypothetical protein RJ639_045776 [Escallonia herrerae]